MGYHTCTDMHKLETQKLYQFVKDEQYDDAMEMIDKNPKILITLGWTAITCAGNYGMPMYMHIATFLDAGHEASDYSTRYQESPKMREIVNKIFKLVPPMLYDFTDENLASMKANYAIRAGWADMLQESIDLGLDYELLKSLIDDVRKVPEVIKNYMNGNPLPILPKGNECCICLDAKPDAVFHPCAHTEMCFACSRDLKTCPICRTEGYAKQKM